MKNEKEFDKEVRNGVKHVALFDVTGEIDKIPIDLDAKSIEEALDMVKQVVDRIEEEELGYIPIFSGRRGFHLHIPLEPFDATNKETAKYMLRSAQEYFAGDMMDEQMKGVLNHCIRIPNTRRERTNCYSAYLPKDFLNWEPVDIVEWASSPHNLEYDINRDSDIREYAGIVKKRVGKFELEEPNLPQHKVPSDIEKMLKGLIRPCLMEEIFNNPGHKIRTELVVELKQHGYGAQAIVEIISRLGWDNFDRSKTEYHVKKILDSNLKPMSKETLKRMGLSPEWNYPWRMKNENQD